MIVENRYTKKVAFEHEDFDVSWICAFLIVVAKIIYGSITLIKLTFLQVLKFDISADLHQNAKLLIKMTNPHD